MAAPHDVVCFGEILWDLFEAEPRGDEPMARAFRCEVGGSPTNVAVGLARLGIRSAIVGGVGRDRFGRGLKRLLETEHVATDFVIELPNRTGLGFVMRDTEGEPEFLFYKHDSADLAMTAEDLPPAAGLTKWGLVGTNTLVTPSLAQATRRFLDLIRANDGLLFVDLNVRLHMWSDHDAMRAAIANLVKDAHVIKASEPDLEALAGPRGIEWLETHGPGATWILTRGQHGAAAHGAHGQIAVPATSVRAIDATGAGDAFVAGVLAVLVESGARPGDQRWKDADVWTRALEVGHTMGSKAVRSIGAITGLTGLEAVRAAIKRTTSSTAKP